jgi:hypothetical protein
LTPVVQIIITSNINVLVTALPALSVKAFSFFAVI